MWCSTPAEPSFCATGQAGAVLFAAMHLAFVATSYDTAFASVHDQAAARAGQLLEIFGDHSDVTFIIKNDAPATRRFTSDAQAGLWDAAPAFVERGNFVVEPLFGSHGSLAEVVRPSRWGLRGLAYLEGMQSAIERGADVVVTINLNLKVDLEDAKRGVDRLLESGADAVVGTRDRDRGGEARGAGALGRTKSQAWVRLVHHAFPELARFSDPNAPLKVFRADAARFLVNNAQEAGICPDVEWIALLVRDGRTVVESPVTWSQHPGSRPPWDQVPKMAVELARLRRRLASRHSP